MKNMTVFLSAFVFILGAVLNTAAATPAKQGNTGIVHAKPELMTVNIPYQRVLDISAYFAAPENKVKSQFPGAETQYGWQHMSKYNPSAQVLRGGAVSVLAYSINPAIGKVSFTKKTGEIETVNSHFENFPIDALMVVKNGRVVYERYKTMRPTDKHIWFSVSKVTGSTMLAFLEMEGKVDVSLPVSKYLPELAGSVWDTVKVVEALDMATGLNGTEHDEPTHDSRTNPDQIWYQWGVTMGVLANVKQMNQTWSDVLRKMKRTKPAYQSFEYNSINTFVVNRIAERVADKPLNEQLSERIWSKAGMAHDGYFLVSPDGLTLGFMGMNSTLGDMARFGMLFTPSWRKISQEQIIPDNILQKNHGSSHADMYGKGWLGKKNEGSFADGKPITNRYQWDAVLSDGDMYKAGVGGQGLYISPTRDTVVAWFCTGTGNDQEETMARAIVKAIE